MKALFQNTKTLLITLKKKINYFHKQLRYLYKVYKKTQSAISTLKKKS